MYVAKFKEKFSKMSPRKRAIIRDYCRLYEDTTLSISAHFDRIENIWQRAMGHADLIACLELADYIYSEADDHEIDGDKRAYLSEHLHEKVGLEPDASEYIPIDASLNSRSGCIMQSYLLECPNGKSVIATGYMSDDKNDIHSLNNWTCSKCHKGISSHKVKMVREGVTGDV